MRLYLVQHGDAVPENENPERPLSEKGRRDVQRMASFLARSGMRVARVVHSGKVRARDTAVFLSQTLGPNGVVEEASAGLAPRDDTDRLLEAISLWTDDMMVVGHMPFMGRMVSRLVSGNEDAAVAAFVPATVVSLEKGDDDTWSIEWMVTPALLGQ